MDKAPAQEPINTDDVMNPVWATDRPKSDSMSGEAPEMMPVSKPNSMPPSAPNVKMNALLSGKRVETPRPTSRSTASIVAPTSWMPASTAPSASCTGLDVCTAVMIPPSIPIDPHRYEMQQSQQTKKTWNDV